MLLGFEYDFMEFVFEVNYDKRDHSINIFLGFIGYTQQLTGSEFTNHFWRFIEDMFLLIILKQIILVIKWKIISFRKNSVKSKNV